MKVALLDALHARPANLLVRLAAQHGAAVKLRKGERCADARKILDVLSLGAAKGEEIEIFAEGEGAEEAVRALVDLIARNFDSDLVPERGSAAVEGIAIGRALVVVVEGAAASGREEDRAHGTAEEECARLARAEDRARAELDALMGALSPEERALFEPERAIVREVAAGARGRILAGEGCEGAVIALTERAPTDLIVDARARLLEALAEGDAIPAALARAETLGEEVIVVAALLTPSLVARLPGSVRGIVAVDEEPEVGGTRTSHAAILARGRELPLAMVPSHVAFAITEGDVVVVDTTGEPARVWVAPSEALVADARARKRKRAAGGGELAREIEAIAARLGIALLVNVSSLHDRVPEGVAGVGLLRTELLFAGRGSAPSESDQVAAILAVARAARGGEITARLWDAGGDKPLPWLPARADDDRGAALLFAHPRVLAAQLDAIARAAERAPVRALIPMTRTAADVRAVRESLARAGSRAGVQVGAMIETPEAAADAGSIAAAADFVCVGTNDLASLVLGAERTDARQALHPRVLAVIGEIVKASHAVGRKATVCGEVAADAHGARVLVGLGVDGLSVAPSRLEGTVRALDGATREECRAAAVQALGDRALGNVGDESR